MYFLALVATATDDENSRNAFASGLDHTLFAPYPNGGRSQFFPLREGYYGHILYNDNAMFPPKQHASPPLHSAAEPCSLQNPMPNRCCASV